MGGDFFAALVAGAVPVYVGAKNVAAYSPAPDAYIDAAGRPAEELAAQLKELLAKPDALAKHTAWKATGTSRGFRRLMRSASDTPALCRLCVAARALLRAQLDLQAGLPLPIIAASTRALAPHTDDSAPVRPLPTPAAPAFQRLPEKHRVFAGRGRPGGAELNALVSAVRLPAFSRTKSHFIGTVMHLEDALWGPL